MTNTPSLESTIPRPASLRATVAGSEPGSPRPRLGFLGVGWIGRNRLEAIARSGLADIAAVADPLTVMANAALAPAPGARVVSCLDELLEMPLDGVVVATPSAMHAAQATAALGRGLAVFCQKPLARTGAETRALLATARGADRLLGVDLSYRCMTGLRKIRALSQDGALGEIFAAELVFHNAYGPDKAWFYDPELAGGGCVIDLGIHLVDLALWVLGFPEISSVSSRLYAQGRPIHGRKLVVEDYAEARLDLTTGASIRLACSWNLPAGREAVISGAFYGTRGGAAFHNVNGSFYEFTAEKLCGTKTEVLAQGPEEWGGRAVVEWAQQLTRTKRFDPEVEHLEAVAQALDAIYENS